jgi:hypothetical protein
MSESPPPPTMEERGIAPEDRGPKPIDPRYCSCFRCQGRQCTVPANGGRCVLEQGHEGRHCFWT